MSLSNKFTINGLPAWPLAPALVTACLLNYYPVNLFAGSELIFGNIVAVVVLLIYGLTPAILISLAAGIAAFSNWGNVFSIPPFLCEILILHWAVKKQRNPVYWGLLYWISVGWIIVGLEYLLLSNIELTSKYAIVVKYVINGILNVLVGYRITQLIITRNLHDALVSKQKISVLLTNQLFYIATIAVIIISFYWLKAFEREELADYFQRLQLHTHHISANLENQIVNYQKSLILSALSNQNESDPIKRQQALDHLKNTYPGISTLITTDANGIVTASSPDYLLSEIISSGQTSVADRSYFYEVKKNQLPYVSDAFRGRGFGNARIIAISTPLISDLGFVGILEASLDLKLLKEVDDKEISPEEGLIVVDRNHLVIYASKELNYDFLTDLTDSKLITHLSMPDAHFIEDEMGNTLMAKSAESDFLGWKIISTLPLDVYDASINKYMTLTLTLLGVFIILSFYLSSWIVRIITKPINSLTNSLNNAKNSEDLLELKLITGNRQLIEINDVEEKLNEFAVRSKQLVSDLKQANINQDIANEKLLDLNGNLEQIVSSKTQELNDALKRATVANLAMDEAKEAAEQAARVKSDFLATMSHEIRTPMNGVLGMAELLDTTQLTETQKDYVESILNSGKLLLTIIDDVLVYSKLDAGKVELEIVSFNLESLLHEVLEAMSINLTKNIELVLNYSPTIPVVFMGDPSRLSQVLFNLVDNAIKFTEQGSVTISADLIDEALTITVHDTGIGITDEQQKDLFESFNQADSSTTRKYGGTGLGLAICKNIINLMGGEIAIESDYGHGANFVITLNLESEAKPTPEKVFENTQILLVESDDRYFGIYSDLLRYHGANVSRCTEIESVIDQLLLDNSNKSDQVMVFVCDNLLSDQEQKYGRQLRDHSTLGSTPLAILSPSSNKSSLDHYLESGFSSYLTKPIRSDIFVSVLSADLKRSERDTLITKHSLPHYSQPHAINNQLNGHILLVEDVPTNQVVATTMLTNMGLTVDLAEDGLQAITKWQNKHYNLIFMDCRMPNMDGYEATKHIRNKEVGIRTPIVALTANVTEEDRLKCIEAGMDAVIMKPFKSSDLRSALSELLSTETNALSFSDDDIEKVESSNNNGAAIDLDAFNNTQQLLGDAFSELVDSIFTDMDNILTKLSNWSDPLDYDGLALLPHSMKSASAYIGAMTLNRLAAECEATARNGKVEMALSLLPEMNRAYQDVVRELAKLGYERPIQQ